jgi:uncharacterized membrane protein
MSGRTALTWVLAAAIFSVAGAMAFPHQAWSLMLWGAVVVVAVAYAVTSGRRSARGRR